MLTVTGAAMALLITGAEHARPRLCRAFFSFPLIMALYFRGGD
jgi:hypothetical protein